MTNGPSADRPSKNQRREAAREKARVLREKHRKRERRNRILIQGGIGVGILAVLAIVAIVIVSSVKPPAAAPHNVANGAIVVGKDLKVISGPGNVTPEVAPSATPGATATASPAPIKIVTYIDYLCPFCGEFERTNAVQIGELVKSGAATVAIHPVDLLVNSSLGTKYSLRAANAAICVASYQPDHFYAYHRILFEKQPDENSAGLTDSQLEGLLKDADVTNAPKVKSCIDDGTYESWVENAKDKILANPKLNSSAHGFGTPLVLVNGQVYNGSRTDPNEFRSFLLSASSQDYKPTATPAPTTTPTP